MKTRRLEEGDRAWAEALVASEFGSSRVVSRGVLHEPGELPGLVAEDETGRIGLLQFRIENRECETVIVISVRRREGVGTALIQALRPIAEASKCTRIWLVTTNDNHIAQKFYQTLDFRKCAVYVNAITESRKLKPEIPERGRNGEVISDEIEYEWPLVAPAEEP